MKGKGVCFLPRGAFSGIDPTTQMPRDFWYEDFVNRFLPELGEPFLTKFVDKFLKDFSSICIQNGYGVDSNWVYKKEGISQ